MIDITAIDLSGYRLNKAKDLLKQAGVKLGTADFFLPHSESGGEGPSKGGHYNSFSSELTNTIF